MENPNQRQSRPPRRSITLRDNNGLRSSRTNPVAAMSLPSSPVPAIQDGNFQQAPVTPEPNISRARVIFDERGTPIEGNETFLSLPSPPSRSTLNVWDNGAPSSQDFTIWEDPEDQPSPYAATPEPMSDIDEDKENVYTIVPSTQAVNPEEAENAEDQWARAQMGPRDAFGTPLGVHFGPPLPTLPTRRNIRRNPNGPTATPIPTATNTETRPEMPFVLREGDESSDEDFWTRRLFHDPMHETQRRSNLFDQEQRRLHDPYFVPRDDNSDQDQNNRMEE